MKFIHLFSLTSVVISSFIGSSICAPSEGLLKRGNNDGGSLVSPLVANLFGEIDKTIQELDESEKSHPQNGQPDFSAAASLLMKLSIEAESARDLLNGMQSNLDQPSSSKIQTSLHSCASHVKAITDMVKNGKDWFKQYKVTEIVIQILQGDLALFRDLFISLNKKSLQNFLSIYKPDESTFICAMVYAIQDLDSNQIAQSEVQRCKSGNYFGSDVGGDSIKPPGWDSCGNSAATYFTNAYQQNTIGTQNTQCNGAKVPPNQFAISNPFPSIKH